MCTPTCFFYTQPSSPEISKTKSSNLNTILFYHKNRSLSHTTRYKGMNITNKYTINKYIYMYFEK